jgi:6-phosphogluconolactonase (cycloisomerase 2 family)
MVTDPGHRFLYLYTASGVESFLINPDNGSLKQAGGFSIASVSNFVGNQSFLFDPSGKYAYFVTQSEDGSAIVTHCSADPNGGGFTIQQETTVAQVQRPTSAVISASGKFLYVTGKDSAGSPQLDGFSIDAESGVLHHLFGPSPSIQPRNLIVAMASTTNGKFIYALGNSIASDTAVLLTFSANSATGALEELANSPLNLTVAQGTTVSISPSGIAAYISGITPLDETSAQQFLQMFSLDSQTGAPILLGRVATGILPLDSAAARVSSPVFSLPGPAGPANLYLVNPADGTVSVFTANPITGQLTTHAAPTNSSGN